MIEYFVALQKEPFTVSVFSCVFVFVFMECLVRILYHAGRAFTILVRGYPPPHCDADGDETEQATRHQQPSITESKTL